MPPSSSKPWWRTDEYVDDCALPSSFDELAGPKGVALVRAFPDGRTDAGWGLESPKTGEGFIPRYRRGEFNARRVLFGYMKDKWAFAIVMRSVTLVCIDIDGKNGGLEHAKRLGMLPPTMAETSKSGDGYHLFYLVDEEWDPQKGFGLLNDRIGLEQGVDIRATGCVYHYKQQRWNDRGPVALPSHLHELLRQRDQRIAATTARIQTVLADHDDMEVLMLHDEIISDLAKPIPAGKRNQTLFAIGNQMREAQIPDWETKLAARGDEIGLPADEVTKLVANVGRYTGSTP